MKFEILPHIRAANLTQAAVADAVGISPGFLSEIISGKKDPSIETLDKLAAALRVPTFALMGARTAPPTHAQLSEDAVPFTAAPRSEIEDAVAAFSRRLKRATTYKSAINDPILGVQAGDVLVIDMNREPAPGDTVVATICNYTSSATRSVLRNWVPGWLAGGGDRPIAIANSEHSVAILGVVAAVIRKTT